MNRSKQIEVYTYNRFLLESLKTNETNNYRQAHIKTLIHTYKQTDIQTELQTHEQTHKHTNIQTHKHTQILSTKHNRQQNLPFVLELLSSTSPSPVV